MSPEQMSFLREILSKKIEFLGSLTNALMLWWVSSIVFCGSALAGAFLYKNQLDALHWLKLIFYGFMTAFVTCVACFGFLMISRVKDAERQVAGILNELGISEHVPIEFQLVVQGTRFGSIMFVGLSVMWFLMSVWACKDLF